MKRLFDLYRNKILEDMMRKFHYSSVMQVPKVEKIVLNIGVGKASVDKKALESSVKDLSLISGQKPLITRARRSIANFKIRQNNPIGCKVTLRKRRMWEFLERLIFIAIPRIRDFRGFPRTSFDGRGNFNFGIKEQIIFPEITYDQVDHIRGLDIAIVTTARSDEEGKELLSSFNFPFRK